MVLQHTGSFGLSIQQLEGRLGREWMDPFVSAHSKDKFKTKYQFYHNDVRALARALGLPGAHHRPSRNTHRDHTVLTLLPVPVCKAWYVAALCGCFCTPANPAREPPSGFF